MPKRNNVEATVEALVRPEVEGRGLELVGVEWAKEGGDWYLRLYIDKPDGVTLEDCEEVSRAAGALIDAADPITENYLFEVSSPGIERPLTKDADFARFAGQLVEVRTFAPVEGKKSFVGHLLGLEDDKVRLRLNDHKEKGREVAIERAQIAKANLRVEF